MRILATAAALALLLGIVLARAEYRPAVLVLPLQAGAGLTPSEAAIGVGIQVVLENMLAAQGSLEETWAEDAYSRLFRSAGDFRQWLRNAQPTMPSLPYYFAALMQIPQRMIKQQTGAPLIIRTGQQMKL